MTFFDLTCSDHVTTLSKAGSGDGCVGGVLSLLEGPNRFGDVARSEALCCNGNAGSPIAGGASPLPELVGLHVQRLWEGFSGLVDGCSGDEKRDWRIVKLRGWSVRPKYSTVQVVSSLPRQEGII
jgi:hypothetical protein